MTVFHLRTLIVTSLLWLPSHLMACTYSKTSPIVWDVYLTTLHCASLPVLCQTHTHHVMKNDKSLYQIISFGIMICRNVNSLLPISINNLFKTLDITHCITSNYKDNFTSMSTDKQNQPAFSLSSISIKM